MGDGADFGCFEEVGEDPDSLCFLFGGGLVELLEGAEGHVLGLKTFHSFIY